MSFLSDIRSFAAYKGPKKRQRCRSKSLVTKIAEILDGCKKGISSAFKTAAKPSARKAADNNPDVPKSSIAVPTKPSAEKAEDDQPKIPATPNTGIPVTSSSGKAADDGLNMPGSQSIAVPAEPNENKASKHGPKKSGPPRTPSPSEPAMHKAADNESNVFESSSTNSILTELSDRSLSDPVDPPSYVRLVRISVSRPTLTSLGVFIDSGTKPSKYTGDVDLFILRDVNVAHMEGTYEVIADWRGPYAFQKVVSDGPSESEDSNSSQGSKSPVIEVAANKTPSPERVSPKEDLIESTVMFYPPRVPVRRDWFPLREVVNGVVCCQLSPVPFDIHKERTGLSTPALSSDDESHENEDYMRDVSPCNFDRRFSYSWKFRSERLVANFSDMDDDQERPTEESAFEGKYPLHLGPVLELFETGSNTDPGYTYETPKAMSDRPWVTAIEESAHENKHLSNDECARAGQATSHSPGSAASRTSTEIPQIAVTRAIDVAANIRRDNLLFGPPPALR